MPRFEPKTFSYFLTRMSQRVVARTALTDLEDGGNLHTLLSAVARECDDISYQMTNLQSIWDIDTAAGPDLDDRALDYPPDHVMRRGSSYATGSVEFSRTGTVGTVAIPIGSIVRVSGGGPEFRTTVAGSILNGNTSSGSIAIAALVAGSAGNVSAGTIVLMDGISGVETVTNAAATTGGQDEETDAEFRARIKEYLRSLPRGTPDALHYAALSAYLDTYGRVVTAEVIEGEGTDLGIVWVYVDDGNGTIEHTANNYGSPEVLVASAIGGEQRLFTNYKPVKIGQAVNLRVNTVLQSEGVDYTFNRATGQVTLTTALTTGDAVDIEYTWLVGLIAEVQKIIDGDPLDRVNYPGYRAAGVQVFALAPTVLQQTVEGEIIILPDFIGQTSDILAKIKDAILRYINGLPINGDVLLSELIYAAQSVVGVQDVSFTTPPSNVIIGEGELARITLANIDLT